MPHEPSHHARGTGHHYACDPSVRERAVVVGMSGQPEHLVPWGKSTPTALLSQADARRREAEADGEEFVLVMAWAKKSATGNWRYTEAWTTGPNEVLFFMAHSLREQVKP